MAETDIKINVLADAKSARSELGGLDGQMGKTSGGMGNLATAGAAAGAAIVAIGVKSVLAFKDLGLSVADFAAKTGLTAEAASRLKEVGDDLGVSQGKLEAGLVNMSKKLGANEAAFASYGVEVKRTKDGNIDVNETFLTSVEALEKIEDPLKRAKAGSEIFGTGYKEMSKLVAEGSVKIREDLASVNGAKVFDDDKIKKAKELRDGFDKISDAGQSLFLIIGNALAPIVAKLAPIFGNLLEKVGPLAEQLGGILADALEALEPILNVVVAVLGFLIDALVKVIDGITWVVSHIDDLIAGFERTDNLGQKLAERLGIDVVDAAELAASALAETERETNKLAAMESEATGTAGLHAAALAETEREGRKLAAMTGTVAHEIDGAAAATDRARYATEQLDRKWETLKGTLSDEKAFINLQTQFDELQAKAKEAWDAAAAGAEDSTEKTRAARVAAIDLKDAVINYGAEVLGLPPERVTKMLADIDAGKLAEVEMQLANLARNRTMSLSIEAKGGDGNFTIYGPDGRRVNTLAGGGGSRSTSSSTTIVYESPADPRSLMRSSRLARRRGLS